MSLGRRSTTKGRCTATSGTRSKARSTPWCARRRRTPTWGSPRRPRRPGPLHGREIGRSCGNYIKGISKMCDVRGRGRTEKDQVQNTERKMLKKSIFVFVKGHDPFFLGAHFCNKFIWFIWVLVVSVSYSLSNFPFFLIC